MRTLTTLFFCFICPVLNAQVLVTGKIQDMVNNEPIPFAHIYSNETGTTSNNEGEFSIKVTSLPITLTISHISYEVSKIDISETGNKHLTIPLSLKSTRLSDVFVTPFNVIDIVEGAIKNGFNTLAEKVDADIFYRQITTTDQEPTEMIEAFYKGVTSVAGLENLELKNGRFAKVKADEGTTYPSFVNFYYFSTIPVVQQQINDFIFPINVDFERFYNFKLTKLIVSDEDSIELAVISFTPKETSLTAMIGELYIDVNSYEIIKLKGTINDNMGIQFEKNSISADNAVFQIDITFDRSQYDKSVLGMINTKLNFDMVEEGEKKEVLVTSTLFAYNHNIKKSNRSTDRISNESNVLKEISNTKYKKKYWKDNPVIKRTLEEQNIVESFEDLDLFKYQF